MKTVFTFIFVFVVFCTFAQPGSASIAPASMIKDNVERTVTMNNGEMKNTPTLSYWQLHASGFQSSISLGAGNFYMEYAENPEYTIVTQNAGNILSSSMMAPIDLPHNADIQAFKACYYDRSSQSNFLDCSLKFTFYRVPDDGCPPEVLGTIVSLASAQVPACPIRCSSITVASTAVPNPIYTVNNKDYFYYVTVSSFDSDGSNGSVNCGNWAVANLGVRGIEIDYKQK